MNEELFPFLERKDLINGRFQELTENKALGLITGMGCRGCRQTLKGFSPFFRRLGASVVKLYLKTTLKY